MSLLNLNNNLKAKHVKASVQQKHQLALCAQLRLVSLGINSQIRVFTMHTMAKLSPILHAPVEDSYWTGQIRVHAGCKVYFLGFVIQWLDFLPLGLNSFLASGHFCHLLITFANGLDLDQDHLTL